MRDSDRPFREGRRDPNVQTHLWARQLLAYLDHGEGGTAEPLAVMLRPGRATANNAANNIAVLYDALAQLPAEKRARVLVRTDAAGGTHAFLQAVTELDL